MNAIRNSLVFVFRIWFVVVLFGSPGLSAAQSSAKPPAASETQTEEQKTAFKLLDALYARIEALLEKVDDPQFKATATASYDALKVRREALRKNFVSGTYDDLKYDATIDHHRLATWLNDPSVKKLPGSEPPRSSSNDRGSARK